MDYQHKKQQNSLSDLSNEAHQAVISRSWKRCQTSGLIRDIPLNDEDLGRSEIPLVNQTDVTLLETAKAEVLPFFQNLIANLNSRVLLANSDATIIASWGDLDFIRRSDQIALQPGVCWAESKKGTNAIGTSIEEKRPVYIHNDEHYVMENHFLTCSAAPIFDPQGKIAGTINISSHFQNFRSHNQSMVQMIAMQLENRLLTQSNRHSFILAIAGNIEQLSSSWLGLLAFDPQGHLSGYNQLASKYFDNRIKIGLKFSQLFVHSFSAINQFGKPLSLKTRQGKFLYASIRLPEQEKQFTPSKVSHQLEKLSSAETAMAAIVNKARKVLNKNIPLLVSGETGVGKEVFIKAFHQDSDRAKHPLVTINCGAIPSSLLEAELFGYSPGAFTGANPKGSIGKIRQADKGILFLDEIGEMPLLAQTRLLRVLQEKEVTPVGDTKTYSVDIRIISATHCELQAAVKSGTFRQDLFYRLNAMQLTVPPLRQRSDLRWLITQKLRQFGHSSLTISDEVLELMKQHPWPGNIRQLDNVMQISCAMADNALQITTEHLPDNFIEEFRPGVNNNELLTASGESSLKQTEEAKIRTVMTELNGNISAVAKNLAISRNTLYRKLRAMGLR